MNMNAVGIDVSKRKSMVTILRPAGEVVAKPFEISHLSGDLQSLIDRIHSLDVESFAGVDPGVSESGDYSQKSVHASKHGSPVLRKTLFQIMDVLIKTEPWDDSVYLFMNKKRAQGKPYYVYMTAGADKFLRIYYGRVKEYPASLPQ